MAALRAKYVPKFLVPVDRCLQQWCCTRSAASLEACRDLLTADDPGGPDESVEIQIVAPVVHECYSERPLLTVVVSLASRCLSLAGRNFRGVPRMARSSDA